MRKTLTLILAALLLTSSMSISAFAADETETGDTASSESVTEKVKEETHTVTIANRMMEMGFVMPNRLSAKESEVVILRAFEKEFTRNGKNYKYEFVGWYSNADTILIHVSKTMAFFYMPDEDVTITPIFKITDITEYYDWDSVVKDIDKLRRNQSLEVDMEDESTPDSVLKALAGTDVVTSQALADVMMEIDVSSDNTVAIVNGKLIPLSAVVDGKLTFKIESSMAWLLSTVPDNCRLITKVIIAVILGSLLITAMVALFNSQIIPGIQDKITELFGAYSGPTITDPML